jgi:hypothetical protein
LGKRERVMASWSMILGDREMWQPDVETQGHELGLPARRVGRENMRR